MWETRSVVSLVKGRGGPWPQMPQGMVVPRARAKITSCSCSMPCSWLLPTARSSAQLGQRAWAGGACADCALGESPQVDPLPQHTLILKARQAAHCGVIPGWVWVALCPPKPRQRSLHDKPPTCLAPRMRMGRRRVCLRQGDQILKQKCRTRSPKICN